MKQFRLLSTKLLITALVLAYPVLASRTLICELSRISDIERAIACEGHYNFSETKTLAQEHERMSSMLSSDELFALQQYIHPIGSELNVCLWKDNCSPDQEKLINDIRGGLRKLPGHARLLHRALLLSPQALSKYRNRGKIVEWKGFTSTSAKFSGFFVGNVEFYIKSKAAKEVWPVSKHVEEFEFLIEDHTRFKILDYKDRLWRLAVLVEEI